MKIEKIVLRDFRQFAELELPLASRLHVLVGINGAGKNSVRDAKAKMLPRCIWRITSLWKRLADEMADLPRTVSVVRLVG